MKTTPEKLVGALKNGPAPVYLLSGDEPLTQGEAADAIRAAARTAGFTEREVFFVDRANTGPWDDIFASAQAMSLFAARRLIEIRIPGSKPGVDGSKAMQELARLTGPDLMLMVITGELDWTAQKSSWVQALDAAGVWVDAQDVTAARFPAWLRSRAAAEGISLDDAAVAALGQQTEGNLLAAVQELRKLALGGYTQVGAAEVLASGAQSSRFDVTQLGEAVLNGDTGRALRVLAGLRAEDVEPTLILWAVWQEMRTVWLTLVPGAPVTTIWSRNRNLIAPAAARLKPLGRAFFARVNERMAAADRIVKGRQHGNAWDALALLVAELAAGRSVLREVA
ncbi:MAG: DNA polymerase III subunit delta [Steroidobacteraceae bacterium]